jgi:transcriptional regulator with XRE-family HTH domain
MYTLSMNLSEVFSQNLVRLRKNKGYSQRELASLTGLTQRMINLYEHNPQSIPVDRINNIAKALEANVSDFFNEENESSYEELDVRWIKKIKEIQSLSESDRKELNQHINSLLEKSKLKEKEKKPQ